MEEAKKIKRISVGSGLLVLIVIIGILGYDRTENLYTIDPQNALEDLITNEYILPSDAIEQPGVVLVDIRSRYEFEKGHLNNAINIPTPVILEEENKADFDEWKEANKMVVLYGKDIEEANIPFLLLYQLGYDNLKLLNADNSYSQSRLITQPTEIEKPVADIQGFIDKSVENVKTMVEMRKPEPVTVPKKIVPVQKKKKRPVEGGC